MLDFFIKNLFFKIMKSNLIATLIFKIKFNPVQDGTYYFDMTTYVLTKLLLKNLNNKHSILDMGTGSCCVIGLTLWKQLGCNVVAEGIEEGEIANQLADMQCELGQGYFFSKAIPGDELQHYVINHSNR